jgi:tetratricopeptide (TPR) repeat protein
MRIYIRDEDNYFVVNINLHQRQLKIVRGRKLVYTYIDGFIKQLDETELHKIKEKLNGWGLNNEKFQEKLDDWFSNFDTMKDKKLAYKIFNNIEYINSEQFSKRIQRIGDSIKREVIAESLDIKDIILITPEGEADSADRHAYDVTKAWGIQKEQVCSIDKVDNIIKESSILIAFNDTHGSGNQFINEMWIILQKYSSKNTIFVTGITITEKALNNFKKKLGGARVIPEVHVMDVQSKFTPKEYKRIEELGKKVYSKHPMGYSGTELLVAYYFQCPNNTFPIVWANGINNKIDGHAYPWHPLFEYKPKKKVDNLQVKNKQDLNKESNVNKNIEINETGSDKYYYLSDSNKSCCTLIRKDLNKEFTELLKNYKVIGIEGIAGCGKDCFVKNYFINNADEFPNEDIFLYFGQSGETIDEFFLNISTEFNLSNTMGIAKYKKFFNILNSQGKILVIYNFDKVNRKSFSEFIEFATQYDNKITIIIISNNFIRMAKNVSSIGRLLVEGFTKLEIEDFISEKGINNISEDIIKKLILKTNGLPFAIEVFCYLVNDLGRDPEVLLNGKFSSVSIRLKKWFEYIISLISPSEVSLLCFLSLCEVPFNYNLVRKIVESGIYENLEEYNFENLQNTYLIEKFSKYRWNVNGLIKEFCNNNFNKEQKRQGHQFIGENYLKISNSKFVKGNLEKRLQWKVQSCIQFQYAENYEKSEEVLTDMCRDLKKEGHYETFIKLSNIEIKKHQPYNKWINYHYAHCSLIIGKRTKAKRVIEKMRLEVDNSIDLDLKVSLIRLYSEILNETRQTKESYGKLMECKTLLNNSEVKLITENQVKNTEIMILKNLERYEEAEKLCEKLLNDPKRQNDKRSRAILLTRKAIIYEMKDMRNEDLLNEAIDIFIKYNDKRGQTWAMAHLSLGIFIAGNTEDAERKLESLIKMNNEIGECSIDYEDILNKVKSYVKNDELARNVENELVRIKSVIE